MKATLLDTCALLWWTVDPQKLSQKAKTICSDIEDSTGYVSSVSVWEIGIKVRNKKLDIGMSFQRYVNNLSELSQLVILPVDLDVWVRSVSLEWTHRDPADRIIVATAELNDFQILTNDRLITDFYTACVF